jgi:hypothetical protein
MAILWGLGIQSTWIILAAPPAAVAIQLHKSLVADLIYVPIASWFFPALLVSFPWSVQQIYSHERTGPQTGGHNTIGVSPH